MAEPMRDIVVVLPGIMGSVLERNGKEVWALSVGALARAVTSLGGSVEKLALTEDSGALDAAGDGVVATKLLPDTRIIPGFWKVDGYSRIVEELKRRFDLKDGKNFFTFPYDWRRDNRLHARRLQQQSAQWLASWRQESGNKDAKLILIAHSMGGLVSRYFTEVLEGWKDTRVLITIATPHRGSPQALGTLAHGVSKKLGPLTMFDISEAVRTFPSLYQLLPIYPCCDLGQGTLARVTEVPGIRNLALPQATRALEFHLEIERAVTHHLNDDAYRDSGYQLFPVVGIHQPSFQSARVVNGLVELLQEYQGRDLSGDGTVPRFSATPVELSDEHREVYVAQRHASLQNLDTVLDQLEGVLTGLDLDLRRFRGVRPVRLGLDLEDAYLTEEPVLVRARPEREPVQLQAIIHNLDTGKEQSRGALRPRSDGWHTHAFKPLPPGVYRLTVSGQRAGMVSPISDVFMVPAAPAPSVSLGTPVSDSPLRSGMRSGVRGARDDSRTPLDIPLPFGAPLSAPPTANTPKEQAIYYPTIEGQGEVAPRAELKLTIDLLLQPHAETQSEPFLLRNLPADWTREEVEVQLASVDLEIPKDAQGNEQDQGVIVLHRGQPSEPFTVTCTVSPQAQPQHGVEVVATFFHQRRFCGSARRTFFAPSSAQPMPTGPAEPAEPRTQGGFALEVGAEAPTLTVQIHQPPGVGPGALYWVLKPARRDLPGMPSRLNGTSNIGVHPFEFVQGLFSACSVRTRGRHMTLLEGIGDRLFQQTPSSFQDTYWALREKYGPHFPIQFIVDEPYIPWELMRPSTRTGTTAKLLAVDHPVARWSLNYEGSMSSQLPRGNLVAMAPRYDSRTDVDPLRYAQDELKMLVNTFGATAVEGTRVSLLSLLEDRGRMPIGIFHFAGHGQFKTNADLSCILLDREQDDVVAAEVSRRETMLGERYRTLVVMNACEVGATGTVLGSIGGWAEAFMNRRFGGFVAPLWAVFDSDAHRVITEFYQFIQGGVRVADALQTIRKQYGQDSPTFLSYLFYGDVMARFV
ncbi:CHAT domain-containing protein [Archangium minus]